MPPPSAHLENERDKVAHAAHLREWVRRFDGQSRNGDIFSFVQFLIELALDRFAEESDARPADACQAGQRQNGVQQFSHFGQGNAVVSSIGLGEQWMRVALVPDVEGSLRAKRAKRVCLVDCVVRAHVKPEEKNRDFDISSL